MDKARQAANQRQEKVQNLIGRSIGGDREALGQLIGTDPQTAQLAISLMNSGSENAFQRVNVLTKDESGKNVVRGAFFNPRTGNARIGNRILEPGTFSFISQAAQGDPSAFASTPAATQTGEINRDINRESLLGNIQSTRESFEHTPGAAGVRGAISEVGGGLVGQFFGSRAENVVTQLLSDASPEDVSEARTRGRQLTGQLIPTILNDDSGRYSDADVRRAEKVQRTLDLESSPQQIQTALKVLTEIELTADARQAARFPERFPFQFNLNTPEGINEYGNQLVDRYGFTEQQAIELLLNHREILSAGTP
ncbi:MAG: hypothetical protein MJA83_15880 [Gammaproteobacteria bacterium]|nr:hypothetical protein [Gammaproteobacteria bacterium]